MGQHARKKNSAAYVVILKASAQNKPRDGAWFYFFSFLAVGKSSLPSADMDLERMLEVGESSAERDEEGVNTGVAVELIRKLDPACTKPLASAESEVSASVMF